MTLNALTFDVEDWRQLVRWKMTGDRGRPGPEVVTETEWILDAVGRAGVRATFFVLDNVAAAYPALVRRIAADGHEVGSHGLSHELVHGYRAAEFSVVRRSWWALEILAELGFAYDSSVFPIAGRRYGVPDFPLVPTRVDGAAPLVEVPLTAVEAAGRRWPAAGGGYFRLAPYAATRAAIRAVNAAGRGAVAYFHPYEFAGERLRVEVPARRRAALLRYSLVHNLFRRRMRGRFARMLRDFRFGTVREFLHQNGF
jgi:peptidoglycan/xylan/chitin deacetylase (PgdA/CDA1 family)